MLELLEVRVQQASTTQKARRMAIMTAAVLVVGYCGALRGGEICLMEATEFCQRIEAGRTDERKHIVVPLMGRFKNETGERNVLLVLVESTQSGIAVQKWLDRLAWILRFERKDTGEPSPAICGTNGVVL